MFGQVYVWSSLVEDCWEGSLILVNLGNDHESIRKEYISIGIEPFGEAQNKAIRTHAQSGQYHTIVEIGDS